MGNAWSIIESCIDIININHLELQENRNIQKNKVYYSNEIVFVEKGIFDDAEYIY